MVTLDTEHPALDAHALERIVDTIERDIEAERYDGAHIIVARNGRIGLDAAIGYAERASERPAAADDIYRLLSLTKTFTNVLTLQAISDGALALSTKVIDVIPEFLGPDRFRTARKDKINVGHLLTHRAGLPATPTPVPYERLGNLDEVISAISQLDVVTEPGTVVNYSPTVNHALLGEMVRRVRGATSYSAVVDEYLFAPIGMKSTFIGAPKAMADRLVPLRAYIPDVGWLNRHDVEVMNDVISEGSELPWVGGLATAGDVHRFAEFLRRGGVTDDGRRLVSAAVLDVATTVQTGDSENDLYAAMARALGWDVPKANFGLGFSLSGSGLAPGFFSPFTSPRTHGNYGAGSTLYWVDPASQTTFVCLTAGVMEESANLLRFQKLSTLAASAAI
ncbi:beta-lactamase family protein [Microbacterium sp. LRZ72]|uniref:serine hydrolase domain-containing protein n=1 Tax=Microbacterium sp. LRZ72 TaxID=2942481 RepID=UPI0029ADD07F|nr:serine hydrolase domain-containing protein [Microbacterium sp. LRZ72]MDX2377538.1 beta-lactamase family protein [Microbacterium sp. LRZ72]